MIVTWHGHACVSVSIDGYTIVFDPHDGVSLGLKRPEVRADMIFVSHDHFDHNAVEVVKKNGSRVFKMFYGEAIVDGIKLLGLKTFHDKFKGKRRGENAIYVVESRGIRIAHLGDLGEIPGEDVLSKIRGVNLLMIPVGGTFTIEPDEAWQLIEKVKPVNVMPMHYWIPGSTLPLKPVDAFLKYVRGYEIVKLNVNKFNLAEYTGKVIVAAPP